MIEGPRIEMLGGMTVVGLHRRMSFSEPSMRELWQAFRPRVGEVKGRASEGFISMRIYESPLGDVPALDSPFQQWASVEVNEAGDLPGGMDSHEIGRGRYAVFTYRGRDDAFDRAARRIYGEWLPGSGYVLADREFFEVLGPSYRPDDPSASEEIWIPIRRARTRGDRAGLV